MNGNLSFRALPGLLGRRPNAAAKIRGSGDCPKISGCVRFYQTGRGVLVAAEVTGLPETASGVFGFHIHTGGQCCGAEGDPFAETLTHYDPEGVSHPRHAGDLPPLLGNRGRALQVTLTDRFCLREILHKTVVIHSGPDDFATQPAGNAGKKIACGVIEACGRG